MFMPAPNMTSVNSFDASPPDGTAGWPGQSALVPLAMVAPAAVEDPVPAEVSGVIELYATQLAKVAFPEIDAGSLRRQADELRVEARSVARARELCGSPGGARRDGGPRGGVCADL